MISNFITNSKPKNLKNLLSELINKSDELKFLVGFFIFQALKTLCIIKKKFERKFKGTSRLKCRFI